MDIGSYLVELFRKGVVFVGFEVCFEDYAVHDHILNGL